jgi:transcriptional regulator with XRE-family HTH domain
MPLGFIDRLFEVCSAETLADVARETGVSYNTLKNYVSASSHPSTEVLVAIARKTGASIDYLLLGEGAPFREAPAGRKIGAEEVEVTVPSFTIRVALNRVGGPARVPLYKPKKEK